MFRFHCSKIWLPQNIRVERGLINGSIGAIYDELAVCRWVNHGVNNDQVWQVQWACPSYWQRSVEIRSRWCLGVFPIQRDFDYTSKYSRQQIPAPLYYAITFYRDQGLTLDRAGVDLTLRELASLQNYVTSRKSDVYKVCYSKNHSISSFLHLSCRSFMPWRMWIWNDVYSNCYNRNSVRH
jgi:hypothetical protein